MTYEEYKNKVFSERPKVKEEYDKWGSKIIFVDDQFCEMMNYAVRYALGRRTYAVSSVCRYVNDLIDVLDDQTIYVMIQDIKSQRKYGGLGMEMDEECWDKLQQKLQLELNNRKDTGKHGWKIE